MFKHAVLHITCLVLLVTTWGARFAARAQAPSGEIRGTVSDPSGALVPSAQIVLNGTKGASKSVNSGRDGSFQISPVAPGTYTLVINAAGFAATTIENVEVA